jgi:hypothetical protein
LINSRTQRRTNSKTLHALPREHLFTVEVTAPFTIEVTAPLLFKGDILIICPNVQHLGGLLLGEESRSQGSNNSIPMIQILVS